MRQKISNIFNVVKYIIGAVIMLGTQIGFICVAFHMSCTM